MPAFTMLVVFFAIGLALGCLSLVLLAMSLALRAAADGNGGSRRRV